MFKLERFYLFLILSDLHWPSLQIQHLTYSLEVATPFALLSMCIFSIVLASFLNSLDKLSLMVFMAASISATLALDTYQCFSYLINDMAFAPTNALRVDVVCIEFSFGSFPTFHLMLLSEDSCLSVDSPIFLLFILLSIALVL
jgi:hypothetical protein